jgi:hypothetical protein
MLIDAAQRGGLAPQANAGGEFVTVQNVRGGQCRYIADDPRIDARMCGRPVHAKSLCAHHLSLCRLAAEAREARGEKNKRNRSRRGPAIPA